MFYVLLDEVLLVVGSACSYTVSVLRRDWPWFCSLLLEARFQPSQPPCDLFFCCLSVLLDGVVPRCPSLLSSPSILSKVFLRYASFLESFLPCLPFFPCCGSFSLPSNPLSKSMSSAFRRPLVSRGFFFPDFPRSFSLFTKYIV